MAARCSWADSQLTSNTTLQKNLPRSLVQTIQQSRGSEYLNAIVSAACEPGCTETIFALYKPLTTELVNRLISAERTQTISDDVKVLAALARILPFALYAVPQVKLFLSLGRLRQILLDLPTSGIQLADSDAASLLLSLFRLLSTDLSAFQDDVKPTFLSFFLSHDDRSVRYLATQCLCAVMHFADHLSERLVDKHLGTGPILGRWEGKEIDFRLLKLVEEKRWSDMVQTFEIDIAMSEATETATTQPFEPADLSLSTANIGGILVPRDGSLQTAATSFVQTETAAQNLQSLGTALLAPKSILVTGPSGSGKTALINEAARILNQRQSIVTLHLNEQTDARSLIGLYTSSTSGDSFVWQPGVLTKALQQGRWILIEDIDRAPSEVLGVLKPIIEQGSLLLPSRKERIQPASGFRVFATLKASSKASNTSKLSWLTNERLWTVVQTQSYKDDEVRELLQQRHPRLSRFLPDLITAHSKVRRAYQDERSFRSEQGRLPTLRDLLKWCRRIERRINSYVGSAHDGTLPESLRGDLFQDAIDCYATHHVQKDVFDTISRRIAEVLNISPQQMNYLLNPATVELKEKKASIAIGRSVLTKDPDHRPSRQHKQTFAMTSLARRTLNSVAAAIESSEPLLLVGETGVGKTTAVQHIAKLVNQKLTVVNLSQQSEATDLLGGMKPITTQSLIVPLVDQFNPLFDDTFSAKRNEKFQTAIAKAFKKQNHSRLLLLWQEAVGMAEKALQSTESSLREDSQLTKRRKIDSRHAELRDRWANFASKLNHVRAQVQRGDKNHTFAFVEGRLVEAVRNGEWVLLDEINLASADTLDHIIGLLRDGDDGQPAILLTESGNIEKVVAHPSFRVFSAMNPATDTGKKDLSPGIRARFTELYVHSGDNNVDDLVQIIESYLDNLLSSDKRAAQDLANAYLELKALKEQHKLTDGAGDTPHFSIRSLVRCLFYTVQHSPIYGLRRALYEGFAMSFFTVLSRKSEDIAAPIVNARLLSNINNPRSFLSQKPRINFNGDEFVAFQHHLVRRGPFHPDLQLHYIRTPSVEKNLLNLARAASMRRFPVLLQGPTSAGKTSMVEYLSKLSGNKFVRVNNHEHTDLQEYLGSYATGDDGRLEFREGVLVEALRKGHWIVLDELNLAPTDVLEALNRLLDDNRELLIPETQEVVRPHPNFMLFATQNPAGLYGGRKRLSRAFRNRFLELHFEDIPEDELEVILQKRSQIPQSFCAQIVQVYKKLSLQRQATKLFEQKNSFATLRDLFRWASRPMDDRTQLACHGFMLLGDRVRNSAERDIVKTTIEQTMRVVIDEDSLYGLSRIPVSLRSSSVVWTPAMIRLFVLVSEALRNNEPVLLVGETGCGKTQICQTVSVALNRNLSIYNAHSNTETGDLIGSQRPIRSRKELTAALLDSLVQLSPTIFESAALQDADVDDLILQFGRMDPSSLDPQIVAQTKLKIGAYQSLFAWNDGSLVRSMKAGEHFLLDEISLADDSVLERLNSVLEPSRTILLAEKGSVDNLVHAEPGFQFLATMNPGGDYGKRELSAALRNRLTEIWVPSLSQDSDILPILEASLGDKLERLAPLLLKFASWFKENMQASTASMIPLRNLLAWSDFIKRNHHLSDEVAFVHGAALVYVDSLGANPAGLTSGGADVDASRIACLKMLQTLVTCDVKELYEKIPGIAISPKAFEIGDFVLGRHAAGIMPDIVFDAPTTRRNAMRVVRALTMPRPILLEGNPGVGKTAIVTALAEALGKSFTRINLSDQTDLMDLFGADSPAENEKLGRFIWQDGPLLQAMQSGGWVLLDEMNLASQSVLEGLNSCLDHRHEVYIAELDRSFTCHPDFILFAAQNPHHQGGGRKGLPASFVNRFTVVYADPFEKADLVRISQMKRPNMSENDVDAVVTAILEVQQAIERTPALAVGGPWEFNLRDVIRWLDLCQAYPSLPVGSHFDVLISQRFRSTRHLAALAAIKSRVFGDMETQSLYHQLSSRCLQVGTSFLNRNLDLQRERQRGQFLNSSLPVARSVILAMNSKWPVILTGQSGSGKTQLIRTLASLSGAKLVEFPMNSDVDTMDLVGGFEQHDYRRDHLALQSETCERLLIHICKTVSSSDQQQAGSTLPFLLEIYQKCVNIHVDFEILISLLGSLCKVFPAFEILHQKARSIVAQSKVGGPQFVWNDGILLDALRDGAWLVLDNANLCNPSVLDRLNSLLEPGGSLIVSEQHGGKEDERMVKPHPEFRLFLTMDPKFGELSRAMRNRSLEVFLEPRSHSSELLELPNYPDVSSIYNLRYATATENNQRLRSEDVEAKLEILSHTEQTLLSDQLRNLVIGAELAAYRSQLDTRMTSATHLHTKISTYYEDVSRSIKVVGLEVDSNHQPQLPMVNEPLAELANLDHNKFIDFNRHILLQLQVRSLASDLQHLKEQAETGDTQLPSMISQSLVSIRKGRGIRSQQILPAYQFLNTLLNTLIQNDGQHWSSFHQSVYYLVHDLFQFFNQTAIDHGVWQSYLRIARDTARSSTANSDRLSKVFLQCIEMLGKESLLHSGQSFQVMWQYWKPAIASTWEQLSAQESTKALLKKFDHRAAAIPKPRTELALLRLRLVESLDAVTTEAHSKLMYDDLDRAIEQLSSLSTYRKPAEGQFGPVFSWLLRNICTQSTTFEELEMQKVILLSRESHLVAKNKSDSSLTRCLNLLAFLGGDVKTEVDHLTTFQPDRVAHDLVSRITAVGRTSLRNLETIREEIAEVLHTLCNSAPILAHNAATIVKHSALELIRSVLASHQDLLTSEALTYLDEYNNVHAQQSLCSSDMMTINTAGYQYLQEIIDAQLRPALSTLSAQSTLSTFDTGLALMQVCFGALTLFVPDRLFDPAVYPILVNKRHNQRITELEARVLAHQRLQQDLTDQDTSMLIRMYQRDLKACGQSFPDPTVLRPKISELHLIEDSFTIVIKNIIQGSDMAEVLARPHDLQSSQVRRVEGIISSIVSRLSGIHSAYDDITKPVSQLLQSLSLGIQMIDAATINAKAASTSLEHVPLLGAAPSKVVSWTIQPEAIGKQSTTSALQFLEHLSIESGLFPQNSNSRRVWDFLSIIDKFYREWKAHLSKDQAEAEAKSKYYAYRGGDDNAPEEDEAELANMFPTFESDGSIPTTSIDSDIGDLPYDARETAIKLASLHTQLLNATTSDTRLKGYILQSVQTWSKRSKLQADTSRDLLKTLPGIVLELDNTYDSVSDAQDLSKFNIYSDSNIAEIRSIVSIIRDVQARFEVITAQWPEHAVPIEVLDYCEEFLSFQLNEPLAKVLTKTEKLLDIVARWQSVASREWSVVNLVEALTTKIIQWRRLELMSWSKLLDNEQTRHDEDANAWYFIAYEAVVHNTMVIIEQGSDVKKYCLELTKTLEEFFRSATLGQFSRRLHLLNAFTKTLDAMALEDQRLNPVLECVKNVIYHFERYLDQVDQRLNTGRLELERSIKEQIQLASWKDVNVQALRDSARRSHYKLFRTVKKYRALLAQPMTVFSASVAFKEDPEHLNELQHAQQDENFLVMATTECSGHLKGWSARPERLRDPIAAAFSMRKLYSSVSSQFVAHETLFAITDDIRTGASELRKQTPGVLTEDNTSLVKHLRERKRRLFTHTMKIVMQIGVRRNLSVVELNTQSSTAAIMARSPDISYGQSALTAQAANAAFHQVLDDMTNVRMATREHSDDLSDGEILRAVGLIEGLVSLMVNQRAKLYEAGRDLKLLSATIQILKTLSGTSPTDTLQAEAHATQQAKDVRCRGRWLCEIMRVACQILTLGSQYTKKSQPHAVTLMSSSIDTIRELLQKLESEPKYPQGLQSRKIVQLTIELEEVFKQLHDALKQAEISEPHTSYVVCQILPWLEPFQGQASTENGILHTNAVELDDSVRQLLDSVFVAMQKLATVRAELPESVEDSGWLVKSGISFSDAVKALHVRDICSGLQGAVDQLQYLPSGQFRVGLSIMALATPILEQYYLIADHMYEQEMAIHHETGRLGTLLTKSFVSLAKEGFCSPTDPSEGQDQDGGKLESGTGLGEGEGADDISKDVGEDEDLSELAQAETEQKEDGQDMDKSKDAVDMGADDLNADAQSEGESDNEEKNGDAESNDDEDEDMDEETGSVDELDPSAVDEKMWDDMKNEPEQSEKDMKSQKQKGSKTEDSTAKDGNQDEADADDEQPDEGSEDDIGSEDEVDGEGKAEAENIDPHLQEQDALDLPEDMQIGEDNDQRDDMSDDDMDALSNVDQDEVPADVDEVDSISEGGEEGDADDSKGVDDGADIEEDDVEGMGQNQDDEAKVDEDEEPEEVDPANRDNDIAYDVEDDDAAESGQANQRQAKNEAEQDKNDQGQNASEQVVEEQQSQAGKGSDQQQQGDAGQGSVEKGAGREDNTQQRQNDALKQLADILDSFHQRREILTANEERQQGELDQDVDMNEADFEHLGDEDRSDAQALGAANAEQAQNVDQSKAIEDSEGDANQDLPMPEDHDAEDMQIEPESMVERLNRLQAQPRQEEGEDRVGGIIADTNQSRQQTDAFANTDAMEQDSDDDDSIRDITLNPIEAFEDKPTSSSDAMELWTRCSTSTHSLSLLLTEQLRLILAPTTATKLRGDFRTGKRLNIKRIIPYIASGYKRDKIWMRRSVPSKRNYQVMIAVDDSKSMGESGADLLALETVAMLCKSLSMLEVGELSVINFGEGDEHVRVAHPFGTPFSNPDSGIEVFRNFTFGQKGTDVRKLLRESISMFEEARLRAAGSGSSSSAGSDLWQLELIVSDGHCSDHDAIRQLVRAAREQKIMIVFVIVDAGQDSIVDWKQAVFERVDPLDQNSEMTVKTKRYLEGFPFQYYVIVRDVSDLPAVLARVLKGWFESVVDSQ